MTSGSKTERKRQGAKSRQRPMTADPNATRTCIFSQSGIEIDGLQSICSVYERLRPFRLEIIAVDEEEKKSDLQPVVIKFSELRSRFEDQPDILKPENTEDLVFELIKKLGWENVEDNKIRLISTYNEEETKEQEDLSGGADEFSRYELVISGQNIKRKVLCPRFLLVAFVFNFLNPLVTRTFQVHVIQLRHC